MDKEVLVHIYNGILLSYTIQSEVSQKEKHQYTILMYIYGIYKDGNDDPICETFVISLQLKLSN